MGFNTISSQQENSTARTAELVTHFLNYCATYPNSILTFDASDMIFNIHKDASFLSNTKTKSRAGGYFLLSDCPDDPKNAMYNA